MINLSTQSVRPRTIIGTLPDPLHFSVVETKDGGGGGGGDKSGRGGLNTMDCNPVCFLGNMFI